MSDSNIFNYNINEGFLWSEVNLKGEKQYYIEGYASTIDVDKSGEVLEMSAQHDIHNQCLNENITMDIEHEEWYDDNGKLLSKPKNMKIPVARVVHSEIRPRGVWVKAKINNNLRSFTELWGSIKDGFLKAFSVAFYPTQKNGGMIKHLNLINITLTGSPVNPNATFNVTMKSAVAWMNSLEEKTMEESLELKADQTFNGHSGKWVTMNGKHVFITSDGKTLGGDGKEFKKTSSDSKEGNAPKRDDAFYENEKNALTSAYKDAIKQGKTFNPDKWKIDREKSRAAGTLKSDIHPKSPELTNPADTQSQSIDNPADTPESPVVKNTEEKEMAKCTKCDKEFADKEALDAHNEKVHGKEEKKEPNESKEKEEKNEKPEVKSMEQTAEVKAMPVEEKVDFQAIIKAMKEKQESEMAIVKAELASVKAELAKPIMKAIVSEKMPDTTPIARVVSPLNLVR